jgi:hypothetical protein
LENINWDIQFKFVFILEITVYNRTNLIIIKKNMQAKGTFEVKITPVEATLLERESGVSRMSIDKTWNGEITGRSIGTMLTSLTESTGAMAYVALEKVDAKLNGMSGSFCFSHTATMKKSDAASGVIKIMVAAGSGTGELSGLSGDLIINVDAQGVHNYELNYNIS